MTDDANNTDELIRRAAAGEPDAITPLLCEYRQRLKRMVYLRLNRRLQGRIDESDVLQEAFLEVTRRLEEYLKRPEMPFFLWVRQITGQKLIDIHRQHLGAKMRDVNREVSLHRGAFPAASSVSLAAQLLGHITSPSQAAIKAETRLRVQESLNSMEPLDREVLALRHFEQLNNTEIAQVLGLSDSGATARYVRALRHLKKRLSEIPGFFEE